MKKVVKKKAKAKKAAKKSFIGLDTQVAQAHVLPSQALFPEFSALSYATPADAVNEPTFPHTNMFYNMRSALITRVENHIIALGENETPVGDLAGAILYIIEETLTDFDFKIVRKNNIRD